MNAKAKQYIDKLQLTAHPEGGYFSEVYKSDEVISGDHLPDRYGTSRSFSTSIYFMLEGNQVSTFHKLKSDELWHFYDGTALDIYIIDAQGSLNKTRLGNNIEAGEVFQTVVKKNTWFGAELINKSSYALIGCTVAPGFDFNDFELANMDDLIKKYPDYKEIILKLTKQ